MKRTGMPPREAPLSRIPREPGARQRRVPVAAREPETRPRRAPRDTGPSRKVRELVLARDGYACVCCTVPGSLILRPDFTWTPVEDLRPGDRIMGRTPPVGGLPGKLAEAILESTVRRPARLVRVNGGLVCSADTRAWSSRNSKWREFPGAVGLECTFLAEPIKRDQAEYERGYVSGITDGDGSFWTKRHNYQTAPYRCFRLAVKDQALLDRTQEYAGRAEFTLTPGTHRYTGFTGGGEMNCLSMYRSAEVKRFEQWVEEDQDSESWAWGYLAGIFDAEGSLAKGGQLRITQYPESSGDSRRVYERTIVAATRCGFSSVREHDGVRLHTRDGAIWRFLVGATPAKQSSLVNALGRTPKNRRRVVAVEDAGYGEVVSLTTSTGNYIAEGWLVHNCGRSVIGQPYSLQHRKRRSQGGTNDLSNLITVLGTGTTGCHERIDSRRDPHDEARGYTVRSWQDPAQVGVMIFSEHGSGVTKWLSGDGAYLDEQPEAVAA